MAPFSIVLLSNIYITSCSAWLSLLAWWWKQVKPQKWKYRSTRLHDITSKNMIIVWRLLCWTLSSAIFFSPQHLLLNLLSWKVGELR
jgi:hypothetical protein